MVRGLAVELMALGKPVVCHIRRNDLVFIPQAMRESLPIIEASPYTIYETLRDWLSRPVSEWRARGSDSRRFVEAWHDPEKIAKKTKKDYERALENAAARKRKPAS